MATCFLGPDPLQSTFFLPGTNTPGNGVQLFTYTNLSSSKVTVYKDPAGATPWTNPIVLDSGGNLPSGGQLWIPTGVTLTVKYCPSNDTDPPVSPYITLNNLSGVNDVSGSPTDWVTGPTPTFVSTTQFTLVGDQRANFTVGRRLKSTNTSGTVYSTITSVTFAANTTVNVVSDGVSVLDAGLSAVFYSLIDPATDSLNASYINRTGSTAVSNANGTTDIWGISGDSVHINGANTIWSFSSAPYVGAQRLVIMDSALTIVNNNNLISIPGGKNVSTVAGDRFYVLASSAAAAIITQYTRATSSPISSYQAMTFVTSYSVSNTSVIAFGTSDLADWSTFNEIQFRLSGTWPTGTGGKVLNAALSTSGTLNYNISSDSYFMSIVHQIGPTTGFNFGSSTAFQLTDTSNAQSSVANASRTYNGTFTLYNPAGSGNFKHAAVSGIYPSQLGGNAAVWGGGVFTGETSPVNGIGFKYNSANINVSSIAMYGIRGF